MFVKVFKAGKIKTYNFINLEFFNSSGRVSKKNTVCKKIEKGFYLWRDPVRVVTIDNKLVTVYFGRKRVNDDGSTYYSYRMADPVNELPYLSDKMELEMAEPLWQGYYDKETVEMLRKEYGNIEIAQFDRRGTPLSRLWRK